MQVNIKELARAIGEDLNLYPGKREVVKYPQPGENHGHSAVVNWLKDTLRIDVRAGLSGRQLEPQDLSQYPVTLQAPTFVEIDTGGAAEGAQTEGGSLSAFGRVSDGDVPEHGNITKFVVMGKELAQDAFAPAYETLKQQLGQAKIMALDIMKSATDMVQRVTPGGGLKAKGDESVAYEYDTEKNGPLFGAAAPS